MDTPATSSGWYRDPQGRFEYRYFNGVKWTSDVVINGQRYVDTPAEFRPHTEPKGPRGMAVASFVTAVSAVALGWIPFVFVIAAAAAITAAVFGIIGLRTARRYDGYGRGFALAGLALSPVALAVCVGGFFFTKALVREFRDFVEPGPHQLVVDQPCVLDDGRATLHGTISNLDDHNRTYRIFVDFSDDNDTKLVTVAAIDVGPGDQAEWSASAEVDGTSVECTVTDVFGPLPFNIDPED